MAFTPRNINENAADHIAHQINTDHEQTTNNSSRVPTPLGPSRTTLHEQVGVTAAAAVLAFYWDPFRAGC